MSDPLPPEPTLDQLTKHPDLVAELPIERLLEVRRQLRHLDAELEHHVAAKQLAQPRGAVSGQTSVAGRTLTTAEVARRMGRSEAYVRELCRAGQLPGNKKRGRKYWEIPEAEFEAWQKTHAGLAPGGSDTLPSPPHDTGRSAPRQEAPGTDTVEIRRVARSAPGHAEEVGIGRAGDARRRRATHPAPARATSSDAGARRSDDNAT